MKLSEYLTAAMIDTDFNIRSSDITEYNLDEIEDEYSEDFIKINNIISQFIDDVKIFPVPSNGQNSFVNYTNSWGNSRTYAGERRHEGTDIMADNNERGYYPVISMTDGVVTSMKWLELGGYTIEIQSNGGAYFYYAHLYNYEKNICEGSKITAGQLIAWMGDSGYSKVEGTVGNFDVHLHVGIYTYYNNQEISINPYYILKNLKILRYSY